MSVVPFNGFQLCRCGNGVGLVPVHGVLLCRACFDAQLPTNRVTMAPLPAMPPTATLNTIVAELLRDP